MFRLDEDLSPFYAVARDDPALTWAAAGAGRCFAARPSSRTSSRRSARRTAPGRTVRMVTALVDNLGIAAPGGRRTSRCRRDGGGRRRLLPRRRPRRLPRRIPPGARGRRCVGLARPRAVERPELPVDEIEARLFALPGVGPYAAAHVMLTSLGRYSRLVLDSWTRPTYAKLVRPEGEPTRPSSASSAATATSPVWRSGSC